MPMKPRISFKLPFVEIKLWFPNCKIGIFCPLVHQKRTCWSFMYNTTPHNVYFVQQVPVGHPSEVDEIFDAISYSKGASVIRMLHDYIGDEVGTSFCNVLCNFLYKSLK